MDVNAAFAAHGKARTGQEVSLKQSHGEARAREFVTKRYANVRVLAKEFGAKFDVIAPPLSIRAEPPVAVVGRNANKMDTRAVAEEYLKYLFTEEGQDLGGKHFYRPAVSEKSRPRALCRRRQLRPDLQQKNRPGGVFAHSGLPTTTPGAPGPRGARHGGYLAHLTAGWGRSVDLSGPPAPARCACHAAGWTSG